MYVHTHTQHMYAYVYICMYTLTCMYTCTHTHVETPQDVIQIALKRMCMHVYIHAYMYTSTQIQRYSLTPLMFRKRGQNNATIHTHVQSKTCTSRHARVCVCLWRSQKQTCSGMRLFVEESPVPTCRVPPLRLPGRSRSKRKNSGAASA
jgi:hypothetical protein